MKWKIGWGLTNKCNMNCPFCYSKEARQSNDDISYDHALRFIDYNHKYIESINYGTGENTLSDTWRNILMHISKNYPDIKQAITTNGYLSKIVTEEKNYNLLHSIDEVDVSLDIADKSDFNLLRGVEHAYDWVMQTIKVCNENKIKTTIVTILIDKTIHIDNLGKLIEISRKHNCFLRLNIYRPNIQQAVEPVKYITLKDALLWIIDHVSVVSLSDPLFSALITNEKKADNSGKCSLRILPNGSITPSTYLISEQWIFGNIKEGVSLKKNPFKTIMNGIDLQNNVPEDCMNCSIVDKCMGGAMDRRIIWYSTLKRRDPYCPYENDDNISAWKNKKIQHAKGPIIHDGYLPTLIFKP